MCVFVCGSGVEIVEPGFEEHGRAAVQQRHDGGDLAGLGGGHERGASRGRDVFHLRSFQTQLEAVTYHVLVIRIQRRNESIISPGKTQIPGGRGCNSSLVKWTQCLLGRARLVQHRTLSGLALHDVLA